MKKVIYVFLVLSIIGFIDSLYLFASHFLGDAVICTGDSECNFVLTSEYSTFLGIPVAFFGILYYGFILFISSLLLDKKTKKINRKLKMILSVSPIGFLGSVWFTYLQAFVIYAYCTFCLLSAGISTLIFGLAIFSYFIFIKKENMNTNRKENVSTVVQNSVEIENNSETI